MAKKPTKKAAKKKYVVAVSKIHLDDGTTLWKGQECPANKNHLASGWIESV